MKRTIVCSAIAMMGMVCSTAVLAQSQVTVYGIIDTAVAYTTNANADGGSNIRMNSLTGSLPSRIGFRGAEDLGGGLSAVFTLESGFAPDVGASGQGGRLFGRQAFVGLKGSWGQVSMGRQNNMTLFSVMKGDVIGPGIFALGSLDDYLPNTRSDNAIGYMGQFSNVTVGATYSFGRDAVSAPGPAATGCAGEVAGNAKACRQITGLLAYDNKAFGIATSWDRMQGGPNSRDGMTDSSNSDTRIVLSGYAMLGKAKIGLGGIDRKKRAANNAKLDSRLYFVGVTYPLTDALAFDAQVARLNVNDTDKKSTMGVTRLTYSLSKRTAVYTSVGYMKNSGSAQVALEAGGSVGPGMNQTGVAVGLRHMF